mmetsp:Transcript_1275/g.2431  ORF Transcript_1275/g.2431 Transcript_1275/m.2431 type:complete len:220 (+) Transcript_1275:2410-3069(+)
MPSAARPPSPPSPPRTPPWSTSRRQRPRRSAARRRPHSRRRRPRVVPGAIPSRSARPAPSAPDPAPRPISRSICPAQWSVAPQRERSSPGLGPICRNASVRFHISGPLHRLLLMHERLPHRVGWPPGKAPPLPDAKSESESGWITPPLGGKLAVWPYPAKQPPGRPFSPQHAAKFLVFFFSPSPLLWLRLSSSLASCGLLGFSCVQCHNRSDECLGSSL